MKTSIQTENYWKGEGETAEVDGKLPCRKIDENSYKGLVFVMETVTSGVWHVAVLGPTMCLVDVNDMASRLS